MYQVTERNEEDKFITSIKYLEGPTSFITTTIMDKLEEQLDNRLFSIHPDESIDQTKSIIAMNSNQAAGNIKQVAEKTIDIWKEFHRFLKVVDVVIPFATKISDHINRITCPPISTRRAHSRVLSVIKAIACSYQYQRQRDEQGRVIAEISDYWMALQIVRESFQENLGKQSKTTENRLDYIRNYNYVQFKDIMKTFGISKAAVSTWIRDMIKEGNLLWIDKYGNEFADDKALKKGKSGGEAYIKVNESNQHDKVSGLPTPQELTNELRWSEEGDLYKLYDLQLNYH